MRRPAAIGLNLGLVFLSTVAAVYLVAGCDRAVGAWLIHRFWPGPAGLLFQPASEDHWEMHDYTCDEYINSLGFRDRETPVAKTCAYRIVAIGDSFTYGWGVNIEDAWCKRLERNLRQAGVDCEVLNLGKPAAGPNEYAAIAEIALPVLQPDLVIVGCLAGDDLQQAGPPQDTWERLRRAFPNLTHLMRYARDYRRFGHTPPPVKHTAADCRKIYIDCANDLLARMTPEQRARFDALEAPIRDAFQKGTLNPWLLNHSTSAPDYFMNTLALERLEYPIEWTAKAFRRIKHMADRCGIPAVVLSIPEGFYVNKEAYRNIQRIGFQADPAMLTAHAADDAVQRACEQAGLIFHSVTEGFRSHADEPGLYLEWDRHFTVAGNALYADLVTPLLRKDIADAARSPIR